MKKWRDTNVKSKNSMNTMIVNLGWVWHMDYSTDLCPYWHKFDLSRVGGQLEMTDSTHYEILSGNSIWYLWYVVLLSCFFYRAVLSEASGWQWYC